MKQLVFQTLEESEKYWSSAPIEEKKKIIQFSHQKILLIQIILSGARQQLNF